MFGKKKKVLVLEDEEALCKALCIKLENRGYEPIVAGNGEVAISEINTRNLDLAILDLVTPKIDGFRVLKHLKEKNIDTPVFVVSNLSQKEDINRVLDMGANKYFIKSNVSLSEILEETEKILSG